MKQKRNGHSLLTWQDLYYDGDLNEVYQVFCEETQCIINIKEKYEWDDYEELFEEECLELWDDEQLEGRDKI